MGCSCSLFFAFFSPRPPGLQGRAGPGNAAPLGSFWKDLSNDITVSELLLLLNFWVFTLRPLESEFGLDPKTRRRWIARSVPFPTRYRTSGYLCSFDRSGQKMDTLSVKIAENRRPAENWHPSPGSPGFPERPGRQTAALFNSSWRALSNGLSQSRVPLLV